MDAAMKIAVILTAFDRMSEVVNGATDNAEQRLNKLMTKKFVEGGALMATGAGIVSSLAPAVEAYSALEVANTNLKASMMDSTGAVDKNFEALTQLAEGLGDKLPGATKDFDELFESMMNNGVKSQSILDGVGKAAAYLAVDLKMPFVAAGQFTARLKEATGVADAELLGFMDTISRANALGIGASEMQYAFSRSAGSLKMLGLQGLQASKDMTVFYASLIRGGMSGETAATSFNNIVQAVLDKKKFSKFKEVGKMLGLDFQIFDKEGKFVGVDNMVAQFDKMKDLSTTKKAALVNALTGGGSDGQALNTIINSGLAGFQKMRQEMEAKASLNDKVNMKLENLAAVYESTMGTIENMLAALGAGLAPILKPLGEMVSAVANWFKILLTANPGVAKFISLVVALVGVFISLMGAIKIIQGIRAAMLLLNITMAANPIILIASAIILAVGLIYANWGKIGPWFAKLWDKIVAVFSAMWAKVSGFVKFFVDLHIVFFNAGANIVKSIFGGIKANINKPFEAIKGMVQKIRNLLPFSPAKDGPLRDIHRIRLVETIASSVKPDALVGKMRSVAKASFDVLGARPAGTLSFGGGSRTSGGVVNATFNFTLNGGASQQDANTIISAIKKQLPTLIRQAQGQQARVAF